MANYPLPEKNTFEANEPALIYGRYAPQIKDSMTIVYNARKGVDSTAFDDIARLSGFKKDQLADLFHTSTKTIDRYTQANKNLDAHNSEQALKIIALFKKGTDLFTDLKAFRAWIAKPAYGLNNYVPMDLMQTSGGIDLVMEELIRIEYGDLA